MPLNNDIECHAVLHSMIQSSQIINSNKKIVKQMAYFVLLFLSTVSGVFPYSMLTFTLPSAHIYHIIIKD